MKETKKGKRERLKEKGTKRGRKRESREIIRKRDRNIEIESEREIERMGKKTKEGTHSSKNNPIASIM